VAVIRTTVVHLETTRLGTFFSLSFHFREVSLLPKLAQLLALAINPSPFVVALPLYHYDAVISVVACLFVVILHLCDPDVLQVPHYSENRDLTKSG
jgi:hypothetical protein